MQLKIRAELNHRNIETTKYVTAASSMSTQNEMPNDRDIWYMYRYYRLQYIYQTLQAFGTITILYDLTYLSAFLTSSMSLIFGECSDVSLDVLLT